MVAASWKTVQAEIKCLNLWNGSSNNSPPAGWEQTAFDDSAWPFCANPTATDKNFSRATGPHVYAGTFTSFPTGVEPIWSTTTPQDPFQASLFRWHVNLSGTSPVGVQYTAYYPSAFPLALTWTNGSSNAAHGVEAYLAFGDVFPGLTSWTTALSFFSPGDNVLALSFDPGGGFVWGTEAWFAIFAEFSVASRGRSFAQVVGG